MYNRLCWTIKGTLVIASFASHCAAQYHNFMSTSLLGRPQQRCVIFFASLAPITTSRGRHVSRRHPPTTLVLPAPRCLLLAPATMCDEAKQVVDEIAVAKLCRSWLTAPTQLLGDSRELVSLCARRNPAHALRTPPPTRRRPRSSLAGAKKQTVPPFCLNKTRHMLLGAAFVCWATRQRSTMHYRQAMHPCRETHHRI